MRTRASRRLAWLCLLPGLTGLVACAQTGSPEVVSPPTLAPESPVEPVPPAATRQADLQVHVDVRDVEGMVRPLAGLQGGPLPVVRDDPDLTDWYRQAGVDHVRLPQDTLPDNLTLGGIFPDPFGPIDDPTSYDFRRIDRYVQAIVAAGATPLWQATYDVSGGDTLTDGDLGHQSGRLPTDPEQWTGAIRHTLLHFNDGWHNGHAWQVRYVEFLHEPLTLGGCQTDTAGVQACWDLFAAFAQAINAYNADTGRDVQIVGPGIIVTIQDLDTHTDRLAHLLDRLDADQLDYLSFHPQGRTPLEQRAIAQALRRLLDSHDGSRFAHVGLWASQWGASGLDVETGAARVAASDTATKILWQDTLDFATRYRADRWPQGPAGSADPVTGEVDCDTPVVCQDSPYFTNEGDPRPAFLPLLALAEMNEHTPERVAVDNPQQHAFPVMAARSTDAGRLSVLIAAPGAESEAYAVRLSGLPPGVRFRVTRFPVDGPTDTWTPLDSATRQAESDGTLTLSGQFDGPSVVFWRLQAQ